MQKTNKYHVLDAIKIIMAFFVVGIHTGTITNTQYPWALDLLLSTAVPFFFFCSGFLLQNKIINKQTEFSTIQIYLKKTLKLFVLWHLVYMPVDLRYMFHASNTLWEDLYIFFKMLILNGETYFTWPLWYLHGLLVSVIIIWLLRKLKTPLPLIWILSFTIAIFGNFERNGLYQGFVCVTTGMLIRQYLPQLPFNLKDNAIYPTLRLHSTLIYFLHMYFVLIMFAIYKDNQHPYLSWVIVFLITWLISYIIDILRKKNSFHWIKHLI